MERAKIAGFEPYITRCLLRARLSGGSPVSPLSRSSETKNFQMNFRQQVHATGVFIPGC